VRRGTLRTKGETPTAGPRYACAVAYREQEEHLRARLRTLEEEAERRLTEIEQCAADRLRRKRERAAALDREQPGEIDRLRREKQRLERMLTTERQEYYGGRAAVFGAVGVWFGAILALAIWFALANVGLVLFFIVIGGLCGAGLGYFFDR
jgi:hypothetical protein